MSRSVRVALMGFTAFERAMFETFFRLDTQRHITYTPSADIAGCDAAVANADDGEAVAALTRHGKLASTVMVGAHQALPRPINLMAVMRTLDGLVQNAPADEADAAVAAAAAEVAAPAVSASIQRVLDDLVMVTAAIAPGVDPRALARAAAAATSANPAPVPGPAMPPPPQAAMEHVLLVADNDAALRQMAATVERLGFGAHLARSGAQAIQRVARRQFHLVLMDVTMEGLDGFHTCKTIKRQPYAHGRQPPAVVLLVRGRAAVDQMRSTLAGADACLSKPLQMDDLRKLLGEPELAQHAFAQTRTHTISQL